MKRYLIVHGDSAAGNLRASGIIQRGVDRIQALHECLTTGSIPPTVDLNAFYRERLRFPADPADNGSPTTGADLEAWLAEATAFDRIEFWFGPHPDSQLALAQMITAIASRPNLLAKTVLVPLQLDLAQQAPEWTAAQSFEFVALNAEIVGSGASAWAAWSAPDPRAWRGLMDAGVSLPHFAPVIPRLLAELPDHATGLTFTQKHLLDLSAGNPRAIEILGNGALWLNNPPLSYWPLGQIFFDMFHGPAPLLRGIEERHFILAIHDNYERHKAWATSRIALTPHGQHVLARKADHAQVSPIDFSWGGTHITNHNLWRWNATSQTLVPP